MACVILAPHFRAPYDSNVIPPLMNDLHYLPTNGGSCPRIGCHTPGQKPNARSRDNAGLTRTYTVAIRWHGTCTSPERP